MKTAELKVGLNPDTTRLVRKLKAIAAAADALAEELEGIDAEVEEETP